MEGKACLPMECSIHTPRAEGWAPRSATATPFEHRGTPWYYRSKQCPTGQSPAKSDLLNVCGIPTLEPPGFSEAVRGQLRKARVSGPSGGRSCK